MRRLYGLDLGNSLDDIGIGSVYQRDILTTPVHVCFLDGLFHINKES